MAEYPSLPLFTDAFIADTIHLNAAQTGAYLMLLMCAWRSPDCTIPDDDKVLSRYCRMSTREFAKNKDVILSFWDKNGNVFSQKRLVDERKFANVKRNQAIRAGKASALKRKDRHSTDVDAGLQQNTQPKSNNPTPTPTTLKEKNNKKEKSNNEFEKLSIESISEWLTKKRVSGKYLKVDEFAQLDHFKNYCIANGRDKGPKKYANFTRALQNSFDWESVKLKTSNGETMDDDEYAQWKRECDENNRRAGLY